MGINSVGKLEIEGLTLVLKKEGSWWDWRPHKPWQVEIKESLEQWFNDEEYVLVNTSGSTGKPKSIQLPKTAMIKSANKTAEHFNLKRGSRAFLCLPARYIAGKMMLIRAIVNGWTLNAVEPNSCPLLPGMNFDFAALTPHQMQESLNANLNVLELTGIVILGGSSVPNTLSRKLLGAKMKIHETYGMTETMTHVATRNIHPILEERFQLLPGVNYQVTDDNRLILEADHFEDTIETNDIIEPIDFRSFKLMGRADHVINSGGIKVHPQQLELALADFVDTPFYVSSMPHETLGEQIVLVLERSHLDKHSEYLLKTTLKDHFSHLAPKRLIYEPEFDRTTSGKVIRKKF